MGLMQENEIRQDKRGNDFAKDGNIAARRIRRTPAQQRRIIIGFLIATGGPVLALTIMAIIIRPTGAPAFMIMDGLITVNLWRMGEKVAGI